MIIKVAKTSREIKDAMTVRREVFVKEQNVPLHIELDEHDDHATHFVGYINQQPVSASRLRTIDDYGKLERICTLKAFRGNGYGHKIIEKMESELKKMNIFTSRLNAQFHAIDFYKNLGYRVISEPFEEANIEHVSMEKQLN